MAGREDIYKTSHIQISLIARIPKYRQLELKNARPSMKKWRKYIPSDK